MKSSSGLGLADCAAAGLEPALQFPRHGDEEETTPVSEYAFHYAADAARIGDGEVRQVIINGREIAIYNIGGAFYATDDGCTHELAFLSEGLIDGNAIECPLHGGKFDIATGRAIAPPCTANLKTYPVKRDGSAILVGLPVQ